MEIPTLEEAQKQGIDPWEDHRSRAIASVLAPAILAGIAVCLRIWARYISAAKFSWDDGLIVLALVLSSGVCAINILMASMGGMGLHIWNPKVNMVTLWKLVFAMEWAYSCTIPAIKMSVLMFYRRIFPVPRFKWVLYFCSFLALGWFVGVMVVNFVACFPMDHFWLQYDTTIHHEGTCINLEGYFMGNGIAECITDFVILAAPFSQVLKLQMALPQKIAVMGIFGLGTFTCIAGTLRCYAVEIMQSSYDIPWNFGRGFIWSSIEPSFGIISACLPTLRPLIRYIFPDGFGRSKGSNDFYRLQERGKSQPLSGSGMTPKHVRQRGSMDSELPFGNSEEQSSFAISVQHELEISSKHSKDPVP